MDILILTLLDQMDILYYFYVITIARRAARSIMTMAIIICFQPEGLTIIILVYHKIKVKLSKVNRKLRRMILVRTHYTYIRLYILYKKTYKRNFDYHQYVW